MIIFDGFWAGFVSGCLTAIAVLIGISLVVTYRQAKAKEQFGILLNTLNEAAKKKIKGDSDSESND